MTGPVFVDTNVIVYRYDTKDPKKQVRADDWHTLVWNTRSGRLSFQVLQESYATLTRKLKPAMAGADAQQIVRSLAAWRPVTIDLAILERAWILQERHSLSWWDALIVATAQTCQCKVLLTEDLQHGQEFGTVRVIDPFASPERTPADVLKTLARRPAAIRFGRRGSRRTCRTGGTLEHAQRIAGHASPKTTKLYDRTADAISVDEIERIVI